VILLDTNALIWVREGHPRGRRLAASGVRMHCSPASLLELQLLMEAGRLRGRGRADVADLADDERWLLDDPPGDAWFRRSLTLGWTRDPFDRLIVAHASLRGWRLATGDTHILGHLGSSACIEL